MTKTSHAPKEGFDVDLAWFIESRGGRAGAVEVAVWRWTTYDGCNPENGRRH